MGFRVRSTGGMQVGLGLGSCGTRRNVPQRLIFHSLWCISERHGFPSSLLRRFAIERINLPTSVFNSVERVRMNIIVSLSTKTSEQGIKGIGTGIREGLNYRLDFCEVVACNILGFSQLVWRETVVNGKSPASGQIG